MRKTRWIFVYLCALLIFISFFIYIDLKEVRKPYSHVNFSAIRTVGYTQLVPDAPNLRKDNGQKLKTYYGDDKQYDLRIIVVVYNRAKSLLRLLTSLNEAEYDSDSVKLEVWIDRSEDDRIDSSTVETAKSFEFKHGEYSVIPHPHHVGIYGQWLTTWKPKVNSSEIAVILEDDLTVSPYFYKYLKLVHQQYDKNPEVNGYSLQGSSCKHSDKDTSTLEGPKGSPVFLYPVLGTWGFSPNRRNWVKFLDWFAVAYSNHSFQPYVPGSIVTRWYREFQKLGKTKSMWSIWHIYYAWKNKEFTLYSNFEGHAGLTANWLEPGLHYGKSKNKATNRLLTVWKPEYEHLPEKLVHLDMSGKIIPP